MSVESSSEEEDLFKWETKTLMFNLEIAVASHNFIGGFISLSMCFGELLKRIEFEAGLTIIMVSLGISFIELMVVIYRLYVSSSWIDSDKTRIDRKTTTFNLYILGSTLFTLIGLYLLMIVTGANHYEFIPIPVYFSDFFVRYVAQGFFIRKILSEEDK